MLKDVLPTAAFDAPDVSVYIIYCAAPRRVCLHEMRYCAAGTWMCLFTKICAAPVQVSLQELLCCTWISYRDDKIFIYRRPTLYPLEIAVDFLKSL